MKKNHKKPIIEIWGTYPPPVGGVTIHIKRLFHRTREKGSFNIIMKNFLGSTHRPEDGIYKVHFAVLEFVKLLFVRRRIIHLHTKHILTWLSFRIFGFRHIGILTLHSQELRRSYSGLRESITKLFLKKIKYILINDPNFSNVLSEKYNINSEKIIVIPAFIPPIKEEASHIPDKMLQFRGKHKFLISANAWQLELQNNTDLYGFDLLIELIRILREKGYNAGLIFCLPVPGNDAYFKKLIKRIDLYNLNENIMIWSDSNPSGYEIWKLSDLFIRPTITDMEGISVKEALSIGTPVIASDVCPRPSQAVIFENRNFEQLTQLTESILNKPPLIRFKEENGLSRIWRCYQSV